MMTPLEVFISFVISLIGNCEERPLAIKWNPCIFLGITLDLMASVERALFHTILYWQDVHSILNWRIPRQCVQPK